MATQMNADLFADFIAVFQESGIKGAWQKIGDVKLLALAVEVREHNRRASRKLPDDLTTRSAWRRQRLRISNHSERREIAFTFRQCFPDCDSFRANSQTITRTLDVAPGVNFSAFSSHRSADKEIGKWRYLLQARIICVLNQRL